MTNLPKRLSELQAAIRNNSISAEAALQSQIDLISTSKDKFHHVVEVLSAPATEDGPLKGVGFSHKDIFNTPLREPGFGNHSGKKNPLVVNASVITQLENAGASSLATVVMPPYACGATAQNPNFPRCINPINEQLAVGGSSSGSAVAVASMGTYVSLGTDTSGSIRIPAATCGITGLKTTRGLISLDGVCPLAKTLDTVGLLGRYAKDIELVIDIVSQHPLKPSANELKVTYWLPHVGVDANIAHAINTFCHAINVTHAINISSFDALQQAADVVMAFEINEQYSHQISEPNCPMGLRAVGKKAQRITPEQYQTAFHAIEGALKEFVTSYLTDADLIILPCIGHSIPNWEEVEIGNPLFSKDRYLQLFHFMGFINYLGLPSISLPIGDDDQGRPVSVQVIAKPFHEKDLLQFADSVEKVLFGENCYLSQK